MDDPDRVARGVGPDAPDGVVPARPPGLGIGCSGPEAHEVVQQARRRDAALVRRCRSGEEAAWAALVERFSSYVYAILTRGFGLDGTAAEDVFQEVFLLQSH